MAEIIYNEATGEWQRRQMLRSPYIDYFNGRFFVTFQVFHNKSVLGAIVGEKCALIGATSSSSETPPIFGWATFAPAAHSKRY